MPDTLTNEVIANKLTIAQIAVYWPQLRKPLMKGLGRIEESTMSNIYDNLIDGPLDLWLLSSREEEPHVVGVVLGGVTLDLLIGYRNYLIYAAYTLESVENDAWKSIFSTIEAWAIRRKCTRLVAYTQTSRVLEIAKLIGAKATMTMMEKEL